MAARFCDEVIALRQGRMIARGRADEIMTPACLHSIYDIPMGVMPHPDGGHALAYVR
jgi:iron complex transport system ATP-binding protein